MIYIICILYFKDMVNKISFNNDFQFDHSKLKNGYK